VEKEKIEKMYLLQLKYENKIPDDVFAKLSDDEKICFNTQHKLKESVRKKIKVVLVGGVFETLHAGHIFFLEKAKKQGDILIVVIAKDIFIRKKGRILRQTQVYREYVVRNIKLVDFTILGKDNPEDVLKIVMPDIIIYGYDQKPFLIPKHIKIIKLKDKLKPEIFKTSKFIDKINYEKL